MAIRGGWTHHSDKWRRLTSIEMPNDDDRKALQVLDSYPRAPIADQELALNAINEELSKNREEYLAGDVLHAANHGFAYMALDQDYDGTCVSEILTQSFEQTKNSSIPTHESWKKSILRIVFSAAVDAEVSTDKTRAIDIFGQLYSADQKLVEDFVDNKAYPQEWDRNIALAEFIANFKYEP